MKTVILDTDIKVNHRGLVYVLGMRNFGGDFDQCTLYCGPKLSPNEFDAQIQWGFGEDRGVPINQWLQDRAFIEILNREFQKRFGAYTDESGDIPPDAPEEFWMRVARFLATNLEFNPATGFSLK